MDLYENWKGAISEYKCSKIDQNGIWPKGLSHLKRNFLWEFHSICFHLTVLFSFFKHRCTYNKLYIKHRIFFAICYTVHPARTSCTLNLLLWRQCKDDPRRLYGLYSAVVSTCPRVPYMCVISAAANLPLQSKRSMVLLEYQAMPSLRDMADDSVLCTFSNRSAPDRDRWCGSSGQAAWIVHHLQNHTAGSLSSSQLEGRLG